ncbi:Uncharacterised protein [Mycobacteroides abscessus subsp. abscessus]|uniref:hypothetical protein n=1 Tax=Mycobacteroides abscessus TaxID=36809 RepID=UPI0009A83841|nr:hypothetical protein [Mycobacteroides abscessus]SKR41428.1 Uncharacterised protein [Mycobacteroides abscessus subsp. abscessus]
MTTNYTDTETRWRETPAPVTEYAAVTISAWTDDDAIARLAEALEPVYGDRHETDTHLRQLRSFLRAAAMSTAASATSDRLLIQSVLDGGLDELISAETTDTELDLLVTAAEAGHGQPILGLRRQLELLREGEQAHRVHSRYVLSD